MKMRFTSLLALLWLGASIARAEPDLPALRARFVLHRPGSADEQLILVRSADQVSYHFVERQVHEIWRRDPHGNVEHVKAFPNEGKSVRYRDGDLRAIALRPSWAELTSLIDRATLSAVPRGGKTRIAGRPVELLQGSLHGDVARIAWLAELALPAELAVQTRGGRVKFELREVAACPAHCTFIDEGALESIEFADLGDKTNDGFVRRFLAREQPRHAH